MKFSLLLCPLVLAASASAEYFSEGWSPGQAVPSKAAVTTAFSPDKTATPRSPAAGRAGGIAGLFDVSNILTSRPVASLFSKLGINITERVEAAALTSIWDPRVTLVTDDNYDELVTNETMTEEEEKERVWFMVISVTAAKQDGISKYLDEAFDEAYNISQVEKDLPQVRWGRIDYLNVTGITTKWAIWQAPYIAIITDRGQTLRFYKGTQLRINTEVIRRFLLEEGWKTTPPWKSAYAPGGSREWLMNYLAIALTKIYDVTVLVPKWLLFVVSGGIGSVMINLLHRGEAAKPTAVPKPPITDGSSTPASAAQPQTATTATKRSTTKQRKVGKK